MFRMKSWKVLVAAISLVAIGMSAYGGPVPQRINYQGTLGNKSGVSAKGSFNMTFRVYSTATGTKPLWSEAWNTANSSPVVVTDGVFNVMLGSLTPFTNEFFATYPKTYLGVSVANDSEMLPRQMIASVGYAFAAGNGVPRGGIIMWSGTSVPSGWALCDGTNATPNLKDKFIVGSGTSYTIGATGGEATHLLTGAESGTSAHGHSAYSGGQSADHSHAANADGGTDNLVAGISELTVEFQKQFKLMVQVTTILTELLLIILVQQTHQLPTTTSSLLRPCLHHEAVGDAREPHEP